MHVLQALEYLIDDILLVDVFKDVSSDDCMQVRVHEVKDQVDVPVVFSSDHILQSDDVLMPS